MKGLLLALRNIVLVTLPTFLIIFLLCEAFFRWGIPAAEPPKSHFDQADRMFLLTRPPVEGTFTTGRFAQVRARWHVNNAGWNYPVDYVSRPGRPLIAVIGDSYIEAFQVDSGRNYPGLLRAALGDSFEVYAFGKSGYCLSQYLHVSRYVRRHFPPDILIVNVVHNDFDESLLELNRPSVEQLRLEVDGDSVREVQPEPNYSYAEFSPAKRLLYRSATGRYILFNLNLRGVITRMKFQRGGAANVNANTLVDRAASHRPQITTAVNYVVATMRKENPNTRIIFLMDAPRQDIYNGTLATSSVAWMTTLLADACARNHVEFVDLTPVMAADYQVHHRKFNNDLDAHWDAYGHQVVAETLAAYLRRPRAAADAGVR